MIELKKPTPTQCALIDEAARQAKSGEGQAGYWLWRCNAGGIDLAQNFPRFTDAAMAQTYEPAPAHPHYATFKEWQRLVNAGEVAKGWWYIYTSAKIEGGFGTSGTTTKPAWFPDCEYDIRKTMAHPDNCKPALKLIDWAKMPVGTMTDQGEIALNLSLALIITNKDARWRPHHVLRLAPQTKWTYWEGDDYPVPEGVTFEVTYRNGGKNTYSKDCAWWKPIGAGDFSDIIAYRIIGLADGWTDDQSKVTA